MDSKICYNLIDVFDEVITMDIETKKMYAETMMYGKEKATLLFRRKFK